MAEPRATLMTEQLQKAADQLQEAIQSVRRRRRLSGHGMRSPCRVLAGADDDDASEDKENALRHCNGATVPMAAKITKLRQSTSSHLSKAATCAISSYDGLSEEEAVPSLDDQEDDVDDDFLANLSDISVSSSNSDVEDDDHHCQPAQPTRCDEVPTNDVLAKETKQALDALLEEAEQKARMNRDVHERLINAICTIDEFVASLQGVPTPGNLLIEDIIEGWQGDALTPQQVDSLVQAWEDAVLAWREKEFEQQQQVMGTFAMFQEECEARMRMILDCHAEECDVQAKASARDRARLHEVEAMLDEATYSFQAQIANYQCELDRLQQCLDAQSRRCEQLLMRNEEVHESGHRESECLASSQYSIKDEEDKNEVLGLMAQCKEAELAALRWRSAFEDEQILSTTCKERLSMVLEEVEAYREQLRAWRKQEANSIPVRELRVYQQRLTSLEEQLRDSQSQVRCDHEQMVYDRAKWEMEKKDKMREMDEIQDVGVKVLKLLLLREKMLRRDEELTKKIMMDATRDQQQFKRCQTQALETMEAFTRLCATFLVWLHDCSSRSGTQELMMMVPVKPKRVMKLIKKLQETRHQFSSICQERNVSSSKPDSDAATPSVDFAPAA